MSRIDYSKWDKLDEYDDLSDAETNDSNRLPYSQGPRVTRLDQPSSVTRTGTGEIIIQDATVVAEDDECDVVERSVTGSSGSGSGDRSFDRASQAQPSEGKKSDTGRSTLGVPAHWTDKGGSCEYQGTAVHWSQDRLTVTIRVRLPSSCDEDVDKKISHQQGGGRYLCTVSRMLPYGRRDSAVIQERCRLMIADRWKGGSGGAVVVDGVLPHPVHANQDIDKDVDDVAGDDDDQVVDWVIERLHDDATGTDAKWIEICLNKASPMSGLTLWWKQPFVDASEIAVEGLPASSASSQASFASAWKEAHEQFQEKIKRQKAGAKLDEPTPASPGAE
jgi:hypothetical protein